MEFRARTGAVRKSRRSILRIIGAAVAGAVTATFGLGGVSASRVNDSGYDTHAEDGGSSPSGTDDF